jgi:branched-chain amino acid transport system substrate-binding protein
MKIAPLLLFITEVHSLGLDVCGGLTKTETFYWDRDDRTRAFTKRLIVRAPNNYPNQPHASSYAVTLHYLKTAQQMGAEAAKQSGHATVAKLKSIPTEDDAFGKGRIRADGRGEFPAYLFQVKTKAESTGPWDLYKPIHTSPPSEVLHPLLDTCKFPTA